MNITKICIIVYFSALLTGCSICPWKTIKFCSYPIERLAEIENFDDIESNYKIDDVFFYFVSNGIEDTMYNTKSPHSINFVFESFKKNTVVTINAITITLDGKQVYIENNATPISIIIDFPDYINPKLYSGNYKTDYKYNLNKISEISVIVNVTINSSGTELTKNLTATAVKDIKRGIFQYRF